jgi:hypothetical protein
MAVKDYERSVPQNAMGVKAGGEVNLSAVRFVQPRDT